MTDEEFLGYVGMEMAKACIEMGVGDSVLAKSRLDALSDVVEKAKASWEADSVRPVVTYVPPVTGNMTADAAKLNPGEATQAWKAEQLAGKIADLEKAAQPKPPTPEEAKKSEKEKERWPSRLHL